MFYIQIHTKKSKKPRGAARGANKTNLIPKIFNRPKVLRTRNNIPTLKVTYSNYNLAKFIPIVGRNFRITANSDLGTYIRNVTFSRVIIRSRGPTADNFTNCIVPRQNIITYQLHTSPYAIFHLLKHNKSLIINTNFALPFRRTFPYISGIIISNTPSAGGRRHYASDDTFFAKIPLIISLFQ